MEQPQTRSLSRNSIDYPLNSPVWYGIGSSVETLRRAERRLAQFIENKFSAWRIITWRWQSNWCGNFWCISYRRLHGNGRFFFYSHFPHPNNKVNGRLPISRLIFQYLYKSLNWYFTTQTQAVKNVEGFGCENNQWTSCPDGGACEKQRLGYTPPLPCDHTKTQEILTKNEKNKTLVKTWGNPCNYDATMIIIRCIKCKEPFLVCPVCYSSKLPRHCPDHSNSHKGKFTIESIDLIGSPHPSNQPIRHKQTKTVR